MSKIQDIKDNQLRVYTCKNGIKEWKLISELFSENSQENIYEQPHPEGKKYLFVIAGQSNAQGSNSGPLTYQDNVDPRIFQWCRGKTTDSQGRQLGYNAFVKDIWIPAQNPLQHHTISNNQSVGFGLSLAKKYLRDCCGPNDQIYILNCALGGSGFTPIDLGWGSMTWRKNTHATLLNLYDEMIKDIRKVMKSTPNLQIKALFWHQGESDIGNWQYAHDLVNFIVNYRTDLGNPNIPFICGTMLKQWKDMNPMSANIDAIHKDIDKIAPWLTGVCNFDDIQGAEDWVHFDANSQREMGRRYCDKLKQIETMIGKML